MNTESIEMSVRKLLEAEEKTESRRELWANSTKKFLEENLKKIIVIGGHPDMSVQVNDSAKNMECVCAVFRDTRSGIVIDGRASIKHGGALCFSQSYNGKVMVWISFPSVEEAVDQKEHETLKYSEPNDFTEDEIAQHFIKFIERMTEWQGTERGKIGY